MNDCLILIIGLPIVAFITVALCEFVKTLACMWLYPEPTDEEIREAELTAWKATWGSVMLPEDTKKP